jgi:Tol biopolymer transport system component
MDLVGGNPDFSREIFLLDSISGSVVQISDSPIPYQGPSDTGSIRPTVDEEGTRIAFLSNRDETGQNADLNPEVFLCDTEQGNCAQITESFGSSVRSAPALSAKGVHLAFQSILNPTGENPDGSEELFLFVPDSNEKIGELQVDLDFDGEPGFLRHRRGRPV